MPSKEKRLSVRHTVNATAGWCVSISGQSEPLTGALCDISTGGIRIMLNRALDPGTVFTVELCHDAKPQVLSRLVRVVHCVTQADGASLLGCQFSTPLTFEQVQSMMW